MCGITGYININNNPVTDTGIILQMLSVQKHRGPDDSGIHAFNLSNASSLELPTREPVNINGNFNALIGFNRLSILDLSLKGHQPMLSNDNMVLLALNGEIYNAFDIKPELENDGYVFKSKTDTEVVLALFLKEGFNKMISRLNGMFAIVLADLRTGTLYIARDRFGIKPIYYIYNNHILAFSSEIKSFFYLDGFNYELDEEKLDEYLLFRNTVEGTLYKGIQSLPPGSIISYVHGSGLKSFRYFDINDYNRNNIINGTEEVYRSKIELLLARSVESQLMSDVKLGCQLSGGVDSSIVTWFANKTAKRGQFESVSVVFNDKRVNEEPYIDRVTDQLGIVSHKFSLTSHYYLENIEKATWHFEAPINHPNTIGIYLLSQRAKEYVTVLLSGEGADEVFGGYPRYYDVCHPYMNIRFAGIIRRKLRDPHELLKYLNPDSRTVMATAFISPANAKSLISSFNLKKATEQRFSLYKGLKGSLFTRQVKYEILSYLPDLLIRQDKMSMAHSIENRVPFLDNDVVAGAFDIPEKFLLKRYSFKQTNTEKYLLKKIASNIFGENFAFRDKMGFSIPLKEFFSDKRFLEFLYDQVLPGIRSRGIMDHDKVVNWMNKLPDISYHQLESLWIALSFEIWASTYLDLKNENWNTSK